MRGFWTRSTIAQENATPDGSRALQGSRSGTPPTAAVDSARFDVSVCNSNPATVVIALVGDHEDHAAGAFARIARGELPHCDTLVLDLSRTEMLGADVVDALTDVAGYARTLDCTLRIVTREHTFAHDLLDLCGILDWLDRAEARGGRSPSP